MMPRIRPNPATPDPSQPHPGRPSQMLDLSAEDLLMERSQGGSGVDADFVG